MKMKDYLKHDRTPSKMKPTGLASMMPPIAEMEDLMGKLNTAIEDAKALTVAFFQQTCGDGNDGVKMAKVVRMIETRIDVLEVTNQDSMESSKVFFSWRFFGVHHPSFLSSQDLGLVHSPFQMAAFFPWGDSS